MAPDIQEFNEIFSCYQIILFQLWCVQYDHGNLDLYTNWQPGYVSCIQAQTRKSHNLKKDPAVLETLLSQIAVY